MNRLLALLALVLLAGPRVHIAFSQSLGNAGTIEGTVVDQSGASVPKAAVRITNAVSGYSQTATTGPEGTFRLGNIPTNPYRLEVNASGFGAYSQQVEIRNSVPVQIKPTLAVAGTRTSLTVEASGAALVEVDPSAHVDVDRSLLVKIPNFDPVGGMSQAVTYSTGGVASDGNGLFHPLGDHSQSSFVVDGQPISDQQSKIFSTQLPLSAIQSMEIVTGTPAAEFGDKTSLIAQITTRSGLGAGRTFGNIGTNYGSFGTGGGNVDVGFGNSKFGNFLALDGVRSGRFLDTPEFRPIHDIGNGQTIFDRLDYQPGSKDVFHLNLFAARNWIQIPNSYDQAATDQDQHQRVLTWSIAPGYQHTFNASTLLTINPYIRKDQFDYYPSSDPFADSPATQSSTRHLLNWGVKADVSTTSSRHNLKYGVDLKQTRLLENFGFGLTDPTFNPVCLTRGGDPVTSPTLINPGLCSARGFVRNPDFSPGLLPFDLTRRGSLLRFHSASNINQYAFYVQDSITAGNFLFNVGFRLDVYDGLVSHTEPEPRLGVAYKIKRTGTVLRISYARTLETPFNENLLLSSASGAGGLAQGVFGADAVPIQPGFRNQFNAGFQQAIGRFLLIDADYFWKYTHGAFDYNILLNTTITFPIEWHNSKLDGVTGRVSTTKLKGFQAFWTMGHTRARYFPPETGGLISQGAPLAGGVFRIDHDQVFQSTVMARYQRPKNTEWISWSWRYDSGLVVSGIPDSDAALDLTPNQQVSIGLACGGMFASVANPITACGKAVTSKLLVLPTPEAANDDHNPGRVKPRHLFNLGIGTDNLLHKEGRIRYTASLDITNLTGKVALYNFLSTFSGTHFVQPRTVIAHFGLAF